ncbi:helix-turn-helix domain-containing protein [Gemmatimonas sp. UBA7669]|uniref:helix-turn-helix domain-containing protein n=1 Tax=Gemmatimonas sp. UBA7669 TaxID=1946568 RepID=UPI0025BBB752|nr:helix-turn-helix domain-containing protein [Gemmatimonas sp. UBA7669]
MPARVLEDDRVSPQDLRALLAIGYHASLNGKGVWASNKTLAERARMDARDFRRCVARLVEWGYVRRVERTGDAGRQLTSLTEVLLDDPLDFAGGGVTDPRGEGSVPPGEEGCRDPRGGGVPGPLQTKTEERRQISPPAAIAAVGDARERAAPPPLDPPAGEPVIVAEAGEAVTVDQQDPRHRIALCVATNVGITARYGEQPTPIRADSRSTADAAAALEAAGVPLRWACRTLRELAMTKTPGDGTPPRSVGYFTHAVIAAWRTEQARQQMAAVGDVFEGLGTTTRRPVTLDLSAPMTEAEWLMRDAVIEARKGSAEGQAFCRERGIDWTRPGDPSVVAFEALAAQQAREQPPTQAVA